MFKTEVESKYTVIGFAKAIRMDEIPAEYKGYPVVARGNTSIILEKDPKTVVVLTRDSMKKEWLHFGLQIAKDWKIHDVDAKNRQFNAYAIYAIEMPKLYKLNTVNQDKVRKELAFFEQALSDLKLSRNKAREEVDKLMSYYSDKGKEDSVLFHLFDFLINYNADQWAWDIARRQFAQDADGNLILLDPVIEATLMHKMHKATKPQNADQYQPWR